MIIGRGSAPLTYARCFPIFRAMAKTHLFLSILAFSVAFHSARARADEPLLVESSSAAPSSPVSVRGFPRVIGPLQFDNESPRTSGKRFVTIPDGAFSSTTLSPDPEPFQFEDRQKLSGLREDPAIAEWDRQFGRIERGEACRIESWASPAKLSGYKQIEVNLKSIAPALTVDFATKQNAPQVPTITLQVDRAPDVLKPVMAYRAKVVPNNRPLSVPGLIEFRR